MTLGDLLFVGAFIVLPVAIVTWGVVMLRSMRRRRMHASLSMPTNGGTGTAELPVVELDTPARDWGAAVQPRQGGWATDASEAMASVLVPARPFWPPRYSGRAAGVVIRLTPPAVRVPRAHRRRPRDSDIIAARTRRG